MMALLILFLEGIDSVSERLYLLSVSNFVRFAVRVAAFLGDLTVAITIKLSY